MFLQALFQFTLHLYEKKELFGSGFVPLSMDPDPEGPKHN